MTTNFRTIEILPPRSPVAPSVRPAIDGDVAAAPIEWSDRLVVPLLLVALFGMYGLLQNPYWVPAGDSELYTAAARNLATGEGYQFNGKPIAIIPPGWSWMMSVVMRLTPYFLPLKLMAMSCVIGSLVCAYFISRRFVSPLRAASVVLMTAVLSHVYQATYWLISEGSFCLASTAAILVAMQIFEGRKQKWRIALLLFLCMASVTIRWAGVFGMLIVIAALLDGQWRPRRTMPWIVSGLVVLVTIGTFIGWRLILRGSPEQDAAALDIVTGTGEDYFVADPAAPVVGSANQSAQMYQIFPTGSYGDRFLNWGRWVSYLYWQPFRAAAADMRIVRTSTIVGWIVLALLFVTAFTMSRKKRWIWPAMLLYAGVLALGWTNVNARYYVPIAFLMTLAIFLATDQLIEWARRKWMVRSLQVAFVAFAVGVIGCNAALYAVEVAIARSHRFYGRYEAGLSQRLILACQYMMQLPDPPKDGEIAVSQRYQNLNRSRPSAYGLRAAVLMTDRNIVTPRYRDTTAVPTAPTGRGPALRAWLKNKGVKYYLYQTPVTPWRVWHFRSGWWERHQTGTTSAKPSVGWRLYRVDGDKVSEIPIERQRVAVTRVPGL